MLPWPTHAADGREIRPDSSHYIPSLNNTGRLVQSVCDADARRGIIEQLLYDYLSPWEMFPPPQQMKAHFKVLEAAIHWGLRMEYPQYVLLWQCTAWAKTIS